MIDRIQIQNFQSIEELDIALGPFTTICGPSNSGKSSFVRSLRLWSENMSGTSYITAGQTDCTVEVYADGASTSVHRAAKASEFYAGDEVWAKCGTKIPEEVSALQPAMDIVGQFDSPFLLSDSGAVAARTLGELTGVEVLFEAGREAKRRAAESTKDLGKSESSIENFKGLIEGLGDVESLEAHAEASSAALDVLQRTMLALTYATRLAASIRAAEAAMVELRKVPEPIDLGDMEDKLLALYRATKARDRLAVTTSMREAVPVVVLTMPEVEGFIIKLHQLIQLRDVVNSFRYKLGEVERLQAARLGYAESVESVEVEAEAIAEALVGKRGEFAEVQAAKMAEQAEKAAEAKMKGRTVICDNCGNEVAL